MNNDSRSNHLTSTRITIACDTCRVKKIRCNGSRPCDNCSEANADCIFRQTRSTRRSYPRGYVEMLEEHQSQMVDGLQELYRQSVDGEGWPSAPLQPEADGQPLTHDLLSRLGVLDQDRNREDTRARQDDTSKQMVARNLNEPSNEGSGEMLLGRELRYTTSSFDQSIFAPVHLATFGQPAQHQLLAPTSSSSTATPTSDAPSLIYGITMDHRSLQNMSSYTTALGQQMPALAPEWIVGIPDDDDDVLLLPDP